MLGLFIVLICLQPVFCGGQKESTASVSSGPVQVDDMLWAVDPLAKRTKLTVSYLANSTAEFVTYLADEKGWLDACNLDVEMVYFAGGPAQMEASNSWDCGTTGIGGMISGILNYGIKTLMYGTLLPAPKIARLCADTMRAVAKDGFECGIHCWDHFKWQDYLFTMRDTEVAAEFSNALAEFEKVFGSVARCCGAPGWQISPAALALEDSAGLLYASDSRGESAFIPKMGGKTFKTIQIPSTLPTLDEILGIVKIGDVSQMHFDKMASQEYSVMTAHAELEGMAYLWIMKTIGRKRIIVTVHNSMNANYYMSTNQINRFFLNKMLQSPDVTWITVSEQGKQQLYAFPVKPATPVHVISPYIPVQDTEYVPLCENMQQYISSHDKIIAFYGHSFMQNAGKDIYGFYTAIRVFSGIIGKTDFNVGLILCIADNSDTENIALLHEYAEKLDIDDKIFWQIGAIDNIRTLWHNTDIYIRPTSTDGDSVAVREVLDEGVTVIASDVCERPDGVITYKFGNDEELENMILANLTVRKKDAVPDFSHYEKMKNLYSQVLNR